MADRSVLNETTRIGIEATLTPGTAVATTRLLEAVGFDIGIEAEFDEFRPKGRKFHTGVNPIKEWTGGSIEGRATYNELAYLLTACLGTAVVTPLGTAGTFEWKWTINDLAPDAPRTLTVEVGSAAGGAHRALGVLITELGLSFSRGSGIEVSGEIMGRRIETGITPTAGATALNPVYPVLIDDVCVYMADTLAGLDVVATSKLPKAISAEVTVGDRFGPVWVLDCDATSYVATVETAPEVTFALVHGADTAGVGLLGTMRTAGKKFLRVEAVGAPIVGSAPAVNHKMKIDFAGRINDVGDYGDEDGLVTLDWGFRGVSDPGLGSAIAVTLTNGMATL